MSNAEDYDSKLRKIDDELADVRSKLRKLEERQRRLLEEKERIVNEKDLKSSESLRERDWERSDWEWSERAEDALENVFGLRSFRPLQLSAINATLSKVHAVVVMPTGAGKSLCYQLPAVIEEGITVVVSPLISLMEDQIMALKKRSVPAKMMTATSTKAENDAALNALIDPNAPCKLLYVTPERFAKSKRFMAKLQKSFELGLLRRIAIDEVHCCSQWGHDFRPDYKFLGILSAMFPGVPILGLTATATSEVLTDVQKMLDIRGSLILRAPFNRPNLYYHVISKPASGEECVDVFETLLTRRYKDQSGIIYALTIKDCEDLTAGLRKRGIKVACYHANLEAEQRLTIHTKWMSKYYQAVVATVAFGLGIDKPDVRFVIHHSISKSMESYYQESGRAGRDGERAECVTLYRMQDVFRVSSMVFSSAGSLDHLYGMVRYCLNPVSCRRKVIAGHFDEEWDSTDCHQMCDRCLNVQNKCKEVFVESHCRDLYKILDKASEADARLTAQKLIDSWYNKGAANLRVSSVKSPQFSRTVGEYIVAFLLAEKYLKETFHFTAYNTISYLKKGPESSLLENNKEFRIKMMFRDFDPFKPDERAPTTLPDSVKNGESSKSQSTHKKRKLESDAQCKSKRKRTENNVNGKKDEDVIVLD